MMKTHPNPKNASCRVVGVQYVYKKISCVNSWCRHTCDAIITTESKTNCRLMTTSELLVLSGGRRELRKTTQDRQNRETDWNTVSLGLKRWAVLRMRKLLVGRAHACHEC